MVAVVVDDEDAARLAAHFEAPFGAAELSQPGRDLVERQVELEADRHRGERIGQVVATGHAQRERPEGHWRAGTVRLRRMTRAVTDIGATVTSSAVTSACGASRP